MANFFDSVTNLISTFSGGGTASTAPTFLEQGAKSDYNGLNLWSIKGGDWASVFSYQFVVEHRPDGADANTPPDKIYYYTLPIPPQQMVVEPVLPGQVTTSVGGIVEEISAVSLWHINLSGTMGIAVSRDSSDKINRKNMATFFRQRLSTTGLLSGISSELQGALSKVSGVVNSVLDGDPVGALNNAILPPIPFSQSAVDQNSNGFTETQELQKFFYIYHYLKAKFPNNYNLYFINYKTNQKWQVQVKKYPIKQSASNPNLYRYDIAMVGWNCVEPNAPKDLKTSSDRFSKDGDLASVNTVGLSVIGDLQKIGAKLQTKYKT